MTYYVIKSSRVHLTRHKNIIMKLI